MGIVLDVALVAPAWGVAELFCATMAVAALYPAVGALKSEIGGGVVERITIEAHDFGPAPCVLRMTMAAFRALGRR